MIWATHTSRTPIGVDLGAREVRALQLSCGRRGWRVTAAVSFPRPGATDRIEPVVAQQLSDVLYRQGFRGRDIVLAVPGDKLRGSMLELPAAAANVPLDQIARMEMARLHKLEADAFEMACWVLPVPDRAHKTTHMMAAACAHADADEVLDVFEEQGLNVCALDLETCALARASAAALAEADGVVSIINLEWHVVRLVVMHGQVVTYERTLSEAALGTLQQTLSTKLGGDSEVASHVLRHVGLMAPQPQDEANSLPTRADVRRVIAAHFEALLNELLASLSYMSRQYPHAELERLVLAGPGASIPGLAEYLETMLAVNVQTASPADLGDCPAALLDTCRNPALTTALGLALCNS